MYVSDMIFKYSEIFKLCPGLFPVQRLTKRNKSKKKSNKSKKSKIYAKSPRCGS